MAKKNRLTKMVISEVSLVDRPANPGARVLFAKRDDAPMMFNDALDEQANERARWKVMEELWEAYDALRASIDSIAADAETAERSAKISETVDQFKVRVDQIAPRFAELRKAAERISTPGEGRRGYPGNRIDWESYDMDIDTLAKKLEEAEAVVAALNADVQKFTKANDTLTAENKALKDQIAKAAGGGGADGDEILKSLTPEAAALFKSQASEIADMRAAIAKQADDRQTAEHVDLVKSQMGFLPGVKPEEFGAVLKRVLLTASDEDRAVIKGVLSASSAALGKGLTKPIAKGAGSADLADGAESELESKAREIAKRDNLSYVLAFEKAMVENPDLYTRFLGERGAAN